MTVYLLHFNQKIHHAQHYIGYTNNLLRRMQEHVSAKKQAGRLPQIVMQRKIGFVLARVWEDGDRTLERQLKNRHNAAKLCPICQKEISHASLQ